MKKVLIIIGLVMMLTGCGESKKALDLTRIKSELSELKYEDELMFKSNEQVSSEILKAKYGVDTTDMEEFIVYTPTLIEKANMYIIIKYKDGKKDAVKAELDKLVNSYEKQWSMGYAPEEEAKVRDRILKEDNGYFIVVISDDNNKVMEIINK